MLSSPRTILLTGGTSGIGLALFKQLHREGHHLIVAARNHTKLTQLQNQYDEVNCYICDLSSRQQIEILSDKIIKNHPDLSVIIHNAGIQYTPTLLDDDFSYDSIEHETTVNFLAPVWITSLLLPLLINHHQQCSIVNISSGLALAPKTNSSIYSATKAAIHSFSQSLRYQLDGTNIQSIEAIIPLVDTAMTRGRGKGKLPTTYVAEQIIKGIKAQQPEIYIGKAKLLPLLMRLSPSLVKRILRRY